MRVCTAEVKVHIYLIYKNIASHHNDVIMSAVASQITSLTIVYSTVYSGTDQSKHQRSASLAFVWGIHRWPVNSPHKRPVTRKVFPFDDVIMRIHDKITGLIQGLRPANERRRYNVLLRHETRLIKYTMRSPYNMVNFLLTTIMTSSNGNIFRVTGHLCGEFTGPRWIPRTSQWRGALMFSLICVWINGWENNREAGDLRRYRSHYDVIVMTKRIHI